MTKIILSFFLICNLSLFANKQLVRSGYSKETINIRIAKKAHIKLIKLPFNSSINDLTEKEIKQYTIFEKDVEKGKHQFEVNGYYALIITVK